MNAYAPMIHTHINLFHAASQVTTCPLYSNNHACCSFPCMFTLCCTWQHIINWLSHPFCRLKCMHRRIWLEVVCACLCKIRIPKQWLYVVKSYLCWLYEYMYHKSIMFLLCSVRIPVLLVYYPLYQRLIIIFVILLLVNCSIICYLLWENSQEEEPCRAFCSLQSP